MKRFANFLVEGKMGFIDDKKSPEKSDSEIQSKINAHRIARDTTEPSFGALLGIKNAKSNRVIDKHNRAIRAGARILQKRGTPVRPTDSSKELAKWDGDTPKWDKKSHT